jgi:methylated-DNA-[protein]-cysteine S-methyltransferase
MTENSSVRHIASRFGPVSVLWSPHQGVPRVFRVLVSRPERSARKAVREFFPGAAGATCKEIEEVASQMEAFLSGEAIDFDLAVARLDLCPPFQQLVLRAEHAIPRGRVSTYGRIAARLGKPKGARAAGNALATNPFPLIVPCHRAIRSDGTLGGYQGGIGMKRALLEMEGIVCTDRGRVEPVGFHY